MIWPNVRKFRFALLSSIWASPLLVRVSLGRVLLGRVRFFDISVVRKCLLLGCVRGLDASIVSDCSLLGHVRFCDVPIAGTVSSLGNARFWEFLYIWKFTCLESACE